MLDTGDTFSPGAPYLHMVRPSRPVWVDLSKVYQVGECRPTLPDELDLTTTVPGFLGMWQATTTGHWVGWVVFTIGDLDRGGTRNAQWVVSDALRRRDV
ncbi:hypothetical protein ACFWMR_00240 [Amycolatopsis thailandensis]|uniref:hypothetical protein n=1 Tax=Amycolatopsis thailandensis TaxID=589330 RepID=UPI00364FF2FC